MNNYTLINRGKSKIAKSNKDFVIWMQKNDLQKWDSIEDFMEGYARRKLTFENIIIKHDSIDNFVNDLQSKNILKIEKSKFSILNLINILIASISGLF